MFVVFLSSNDWRKWLNSAFRKTPLFKNCRCERLSLLYISKIEIYNPLSALLLTLICHFYYALLTVAIFVLNVAIATYFERRQKELSTKTLLWKIYRGKVVQFFTAQPLSSNPISNGSNFSLQGVEHSQAYMDTDRHTLVPVLSPWSLSQPSSCPALLQWYHT